MSTLIRSIKALILGTKPIKRTPRRIHIENLKRNIIAGDRELDFLIEDHFDYFPDYPDLHLEINPRYRYLIDKQRRRRATYQALTGEYI